MKRYLDLLKETFRQWNSHEAPRMGAALAFYSVLSLAPLLILVVGICALVFGEGPFSVGRNGSGAWISTARFTGNQRRVRSRRKVLCDCGFSPARRMGGGKFHCFIGCRGGDLRADPSLRA